MSTDPVRVPLAPLLAVNFVGTLGFSIVLPFLVFLITAWGGNAFIYGIIGATYSTFQLIGAPILGRWSDRVGRRRILLLSQAGTLLSWLVFLVAFALPEHPLIEVESSRIGAFAITLPLLVVFVARALDGLTGGNVSVATAYLADVSTEETRNANFGKLSVSGNLGFILGPALAGVLGATAMGRIGPVLAAAIISLAAMILIIVRLPESRPCVMTEDPDQDDATHVFGQEHRPCFEMAGTDLSARAILRLPEVPRFLVVYFLVMLGFNVFYVSFPVHAVEGLRWQVSETGTFFAVLSALMALVQGPVLGWASRRFREPVLARTGSAILAMGFLFFASFRTDLAYAGAACMALGNGLLWPSVVSLLSRAAGDRHQGAVQGFAGSVGAVASITGLLLGGALFDAVGPRVFWLSAVLIGVSLVMVGRVRGPRAPLPATAAASGA